MKQIVLTMKQLISVIVLLTLLHTGINLSPLLMIVKNMIRLPRFR